MGMRLSNKSFRLIGFWATPLWTLLSLTVAIPSQPAFAVQRNNFQLCASELLRGGISAAVAAEACAASLYPKDLTICVTQIYQQTNIAARDALSTCTKVRRPRDLATCVVNISNGTQNSLAPDVLDNCRSSLLPVRFAECVVGLNREVDFSVGQMMGTCIDASDRPQDFYPPGVVPRQTSSPSRPILVPPNAPPFGPTRLPVVPIEPRGF
ncbi:hypothetical protein LAY57_02330 [Argonema antarcticum A004/B2]|nr:hypothetical protein [Argonema antarcticum A004/B2]